MSEHQTRTLLDGDGLHIEAHMNGDGFEMKVAPAPLWARDEHDAVAHIEINPGDGFGFGESAYLTRLQAMALANYLLDLSREV